MKKAYIMVVMFATLSLSTFSACGDTSTAPPPTVLNPDEDNSDGSDGGEGDETSEMTRIYDVVKKNLACLYSFFAKYPVVRLKIMSNLIVGFALIFQLCCYGIVEKSGNGECGSGEEIHYLVFE